MRSSDVVAFVIAPVRSEQLIVAVAGLLVVLARALEHQVLEQMSRSGRAIRFIARADAIGDHHRDRRRRMIGQQEHRQAVGVEPVFGNSLFGPHMREAIWNFRISGQARQRYAAD